MDEITKTLKDGVNASINGEFDANQASELQKKTEEWLAKLIDTIEGKQYGGEHAYKINTTLDHLLTNFEDLSEAVNLYKKILKVLAKKTRKN